MSKITAALEAAVASVIENTPKDGTATARQRANADKAFALILKLIAPRIRHFIRQYGLTAHWDDAEQCCAIGVHRAIQAYEPEKAQFTTFVNWQLRGELQSLRFRLMTDQRPSARKVEATTVSLHAVSTGPDGEENALEAMLVDEDALALTESGASDHLAAGARNALIDAYVDHLRTVGMEQLQRRAQSKRIATEVRPDMPHLRSRLRSIDPAEVARLEQKLAQHRAIVEGRLSDHASLEELGDEIGGTKEQVRQITKRAVKTISELAAKDARFGEPIGYRRRKPAAPRSFVPQAQPSVLPAPDAPHNRLSRVVAIDPEQVEAEAIALPEDAPVAAKPRRLVTAG